MNKQDYLSTLEKALRAAHMEDLEDILGEYSEHFELKLQDGYSEEEIAAKLAAPEEIASQFAGISAGSDEKKGRRLLLSVGLVFADVFALPFFLALFAWVFALGALSIAAVGLGVVVITKIALADIIPNMPFISTLFSGLLLLSLAALAAIGTEYCRLFAAQLLKVYMRWHKTVAKDDGYPTPPLSMYPQIKPKKRRTMRAILLISLATCAVCCAAWYVSMVIATGAIEPWHALYWFE